MKLFAKGKGGPGAPTAVQPQFQPIDRAGLLSLLDQLVNSGGSGTLQLMEPRGAWTYAFQAGALTHASGGRVRGARQAFDLLWEFQQGQFVFIPGPNPELGSNLYIDKARLLEMLRRSQAVLQGPASPYIPPDQQRPIAPVNPPFNPQPGAAPAAWQQAPQRTQPAAPVWQGVPAAVPGYPPAYPNQPYAPPPNQPYGPVPAGGLPPQRIPAQMPQQAPPPPVYQGQPQMPGPPAYPGQPQIPGPPAYQGQPPMPAPPAYQGQPQMPAPPGFMPTQAAPAYAPPAQPMPGAAAPPMPAAPAPPARRPATPPSFSVPPMAIPRKKEPVYQAPAAASLAPAPPQSEPKPAKAGDDLRALRASLVAQGPAPGVPPAAPTWGVRKTDGTVVAPPPAAKTQKNGKQKKRSKLSEGIRVQLIKFLLWACERKYSPDDHWTLKDAFEVSTMELRDQFVGAFSQSLKSNKGTGAAEDDADELNQGRMRGRARARKR